MSKENTITERIITWFTKYRRGWICCPKHMDCSKCRQRETCEFQHVVEDFNRIIEDQNRKIQRLHSLWFQQKEWVQQDKEEFARVLKELGKVKT